MITIDERGWGRLRAIPVNRMRPQDLTISVELSYTEILYIRIPIGWLKTKRIETETDEPRQDSIWIKTHDEGIYT